MVILPLLCYFLFLGLVTVICYLSLNGYIILSKAGTASADNTFCLHICITRWLTNFERPPYKSLLYENQKGIEEKYLGNFIWELSTLLAVGKMQPLPSEESQDLHSKQLKFPCKKEDFCEVIIKKATFCSQSLWLLTNLY